MATWHDVLDTARLANCYSRYMAVKILYKSFKIRLFFLLSSFFFLIQVYFSVSTFTLLAVVPSISSINLYRFSSNFIAKLSSASPHVPLRLISSQPIV